MGVLQLEQRLCLARARLRSCNGFRNFRNCREKRFDGIFAPIHFKRGARGSPPMRSSQTSRRASSDASRSREKKHLHLRKQKALANADADADDDDAGVFDRPPSTRPHDLRASPDDEAKHAFRGTCRGTCDDRSESERRGRVSSSRDRKPRRLGGRRNRRGHIYVSIAPIG